MLGGSMSSVEEIIETNLKLIESMVRDNKTNKEIAETLGISYSSFKRYKNQNVSLKDLMAQCKDEKSEEVEKALFENCTGYYYDDEVAVKVKEETLADDGETILSKERVVVKKLRKYSRPDFAAQKYWLNNMKKNKWKDDPHGVSNNNKLTNIKVKEAKIKEKLITGDDGTK